MRVLVTGTDGYIGCVLGEVLLGRGHDVTGLDTGFYRAGWLFNGLPQMPYTLNKDIRRVTAEELQGYDAVVHLAELSNDPLAQHNPELTFKINHLGSVSLARAAKTAGVPRFIYTSSCSVYGIGSGDDYMTEESPVNPQTAYAQCKVLVERDVSALADDSFSPTFLRNATAYGASPRMRFDIVLNNLSGLAWTTREIKMTSDGTPWRPLVHVRDICDAVVCVLEAPREVVHRQVLNVGDTRENYRVREVAEVVSAAIPGCAVSFGKNDGDNRSYRVSFDKIREVLPTFECRRDIRYGAQELAGVYERIGLTDELFKFPAFTRVKQLQHLVKTQQLDDEFFWK